MWNPSDNIMKLRRLVYSEEYLDILQEIKELVSLSNIEVKNQKTLKGKLVVYEKLTSLINNTLNKNNI